VNILITGSNGLLGQKLVYKLLEKTGVGIIASSKGANRIFQKEGYTYVDTDITDPDAVHKLISQYRPDCIINTAAMTNVDACEKDKEACKKANIDAVRFIIEAALPLKAHLIHLSTDFVFDGKSGPYKEDDEVNPLSYYASSKLESEKLVMQSGLDWAILRTIIIYGVVDDVQRSNLVLWTKSSLEKGEKINVINDQFRSPTLAEDLADACILAAMKRAKGIYHISGPESDLDSILNLAYRIADFFHLDKSLINPVTSDELNQPARRPPRTGFILYKARKELGYKPHDLEEGLKIVAAQLANKQAAENKKL